MGIWKIFSFSLKPKFYEIYQNHFKSMIDKYILIINFPYNNKNMKNSAYILKNVTSWQDTMLFSGQKI